MKINIITTLFFALKASIAHGFAIYGDCGDFDIHTDEDCVAQCESFEVKWEGYQEGPRDSITLCSCTLQATKEDIENGFPAENHFDCTRTPEPERPVTITGDCDDFGITTWDDCKNKCSFLAAGDGFSATVNGGMGNISGCFCDHGREREHYFTCTREPIYPPIPERRSQRCSESGIDDQDTCFAFCLDYKRLPQYVGNDDGLLMCRCFIQDYNSEPSFECKSGQVSHLRSG